MIFCWGCNGLEHLNVDIITKDKTCLLGYRFKAEYAKGFTKEFEHKYNDAMVLKAGKIKIKDFDGKRDLEQVMNMLLTE